MTRGIPRFSLRLVPEGLQETLCGALRANGGRVRCELPADHRVGSASTGGPWVMAEHQGRDALGRWHLWPRGV